MDHAVKKQLYASLYGAGEVSQARLVGQYPPPCLHVAVDPGGKDYAAAVIVDRRTGEVLWSGVLPS